MAEFSHCPFWGVPVVSGRNDPPAIYGNRFRYLSLPDAAPSLSVPRVAKLANFLDIGADFVLFQRNQEHPLPADPV